MIKTETQIWYGVFCDECGTPGPYAGKPEKANDKAKEQGWLVLETGYHFCPNHKETTKAILADIGFVGEKLEMLVRREEERARVREAKEPKPDSE